MSKAAVRILIVAVVLLTAPLPHALLQARALDRLTWTNPLDKRVETAEGVWYAECAEPEKSVDRGIGTSVSTSYPISTATSKPTLRMSEAERAHYESELAHADSTLVQRLASYFDALATLDRRRLDTCRAWHETAQLQTALILVLGLAAVVVNERRTVA